MRDGEPIDDEIYESMVIPGGQEPPHLHHVEAKHQPPANAGDAVPWDRQPLSTINSIDGPAALQVENLGPEPGKLRQTRSSWSRSAAGENSSTPGKPIPEGSTGRNINSSVQAGGYTLQMAAFPSQESCDRFVNQQRPRELAVYRRDIASGTRQWCILTHGNYPTEQEALKASKNYGQKYANLTFRVRSWESIIELE